MPEQPPPGVELSPDEVADRIGLLRLLRLRTVDGPPDRVVVEMPVTDEIMNLHEIPHGGAIATLADHTAGMTCAVLTPFRVSTVDLHVRFLAPARGTVVRAEGAILRTGKRLIIVEVRITDDLGTLVAVVTSAMAPWPTA